MLLWLDKIPHACFKVESPSVLIREEISRLLENRLRARFGAVQRGLLWRWGRVRSVRIQVGQHSVSVLWHANRINSEEWLLTVTDIPSLWDRLRGRKRALRTEELKLVAREIHGLLTSVFGISQVRWYLEAANGPGGKAAWTPDELPWIEA